MGAPASASASLLILATALGLPTRPLAGAVADLWLGPVNTFALALAQPTRTPRKRRRPLKPGLTRFPSARARAGTKVAFLDVCLEKVLSKTRPNMPPFPTGTS